MSWNSFGSSKKMVSKETSIQEAERLFAERCVAQAKEAGFDLDFAFEARPEEEALVEELRSINIKTFWTDNPFEPKVEESSMLPEVREEYQRLMARKAEIGSIKERLLAYLAPYVPAAEFWKQDVAAQKDIDQRIVDRALDFWTTKYGHMHRQWFLATITLLNL